MYLKVITETLPEIKNITEALSLNFLPEVSKPLCTDYITNS